MQSNAITWLKHAATLYLVHRIPPCPSWPEQRCQSQKCIGNSMEGSCIRQAAIPVTGLALRKGLSNTWLYKSIKAKIVPCYTMLCPQGKCHSTHWDTQQCASDASVIKERGHVHQIVKLPALRIALCPQLTVIPSHTMSHLSDAGAAHP